MCCQSNRASTEKHIHISLNQPRFHDFDLTHNITVYNMKIKIIIRNNINTITALSVWKKKKHKHDLTSYTKIVNDRYRTIKCIRFVMVIGMYNGSNDWKPKGS